MTIEKRFSHSLEKLLPQPAPAALGVAVSGGGDSTALLHLLAGWAARHRVKLHVVSVNHGLRPEAEQELDQVAGQCKRLNLPHDVLEWEGRQAKGNLQAEARRARYGLIAAWARTRNIAHVMLGHTLDDQAETFLMRLSRGAGVDGLSAMAPSRMAHGICWLRPLLGERRESLRQWLRSAGIGWSEDASNDDTRFARVRARKALAMLAPLGLEREDLARAARRMADARLVLDQATQEAARTLVRHTGGGVQIDRAGFLVLPAEIRRRLLVHALRWVASAEYAPRHEALIGALSAIEQVRSVTLHGCFIRVSARHFLIVRELAALHETVALPGEIWDGRWRVNGPSDAQAQVRALGDNGLKTIMNWRKSGYVRDVLLVSPAVWRGGELVAAPLVSPDASWRAELIHHENDFITSVLSH